MKEIYIGINWEQNSTAALMVDGKILGSISEERFSRIKMMKDTLIKRLIGF